MGSYYDLKNETPPAYPIFESVRKPVVLESLSNAASDSPRIVRIFAFGEKIAAREDIEIVNLLRIAILESLVFDREGIRNAWNALGPQTRKLTQETAKRRGWEGNLPVRPRI